MCEHKREDAFLVCAHIHLEGKHTDAGACTDYWEHDIPIDFTLVRHDGFSKTLSSSGKKKGV
jgi:hypothetical protein